MARIKIEDLQPLEELTDDQLSDVVGGITSLGTLSYDAWMPSATTSYDAWMPSLTTTSYDAWMPSKTAAYDAWMP